MKNSAYFGAFIKQEYQKIIIDGFIQFKEQIHELCRIYCSRNEIKDNNNRIYQLYHFIIIQYLFGLNRGQILSIISLKQAPMISNYILKLGKTIPSRSWSSPRINDIIQSSSENFFKFMAQFQDFFYQKIGEISRNRFIPLFRSSKKKMTPPFQIFIGIIPPSKIFPNMDVITRGAIMPYFNARLYLHINYISSTKEFMGEIKKLEYFKDKYIYKLSSEFGFLTGAPGKNMFYQKFKLIERILGNFEEKIDFLLAEKGVHDLTVVSVDGTNIPIDKRDGSASNGMGSRGFFLDKNVQSEQEPTVFQ